MLNPSGFEVLQRNIPISEEDLNRAFPGNPQSTLAKRIAHIIFNMILDTKPTLVLDLHNDWNKSIPYVLIDKINKDEKYLNEIHSFARETGLLIIYDTEFISGSLTYNLNQKKIPSLVLELGESMVINEENIQYGIKSIINILAKLMMVELKSDKFSYPLNHNFKNKVLKYSIEPLSASSGIVRFLKKPGDMISNGDILATLWDSFGKKIDTLISKNRGIVIGHSDYSIAYPGAPIMAFGIIDNKSR